MMMIIMESRGRSNTMQQPIPSCRQPLINITKRTTSDIVGPICASETAYLSIYLINRGRPIHLDLLLGTLVVYFWGLSRHFGVLGHFH